MDETGYVDQRFFAREFVVYLMAQLGMFTVFLSIPITSPVLARPILFVAEKIFYVYIIHEAVFKKILLHKDFDRTQVDEYLAFVLLTFIVSFTIACCMKKIEKLCVSFLHSRKNSLPRNNASAPACISGRTPS